MTAQPVKAPFVDVTTICKNIRALNSKVAQREVLEFIAELLRTRYSH